MTDPDPAVWTAEDMRDPSRWTLTLSEAQVGEILTAAARTQEAGLAIHEISRDSFALPTLATILEQTRRELIEGRGFLLLRGLPIENCDRERIVRAYVGIGTYIGTAVPQNAQGHLVGHVKDLGNDPQDPKTRIYTTSYRQPFHVDSCDIVGLLCLRTAKAGGASAICSSTALYREIEHSRPDLRRRVAPAFHLRPQGRNPGRQGTALRHADCPRT